MIPKEASPSADTPELKRELSLLDSTMLNVGCMIGSGIFLVPASIALILPSSPSIILVWIFGGIISLFGALSVAELGAMYPNAGGQYVYLREAYGPLSAFLYGWTAFTVILTAAISAVAVGFATYLGYFIPLSAMGIKIIAIWSIILLTTINCFGIRLGAIVQNGFTILKLLIIVALIVLGFTMTNAQSLDLSLTNIPFSFSSFLGPFGIALVAVLWSYDGWIEITYVAGEVKNPQKNIPRSIILSMLIVLVIYTLVNITYLRVLPLEKIGQSTLVAADTATKLIGSAGASIAAITVMIATIGSNNGFILSGARIYYAMGIDNSFPKIMASVHPRFHTPIPSLIAQGVWSCLLVLSGTFDQLFTYVIFASWIFYAMAAGAVLILRKRSPELPRAYATWGYPYTPIIFILFSLYLVGNTLFEDPRDALFGLGIILLGIPAYYYWRWKASLPPRF
ncbi:MAG: amino acid permease [bacterium]